MRLSLITIILIFSRLCRAGEFVEYSNKMNENINKYSFYFIDENNYSYESIKLLDKLFASRVENENHVLKLNRTKTWVKTVIKNNSVEEKKIILSFSPAYLGKIFVFDKNGIATTGGSLEESAVKDIYSAQVVPVKLAPGENTIISSIDSVGSAISIRAMSEENFMMDKNKSQVLFFFLMGAIAVLALYHLFIFFTSKEYVYLFYVLYLFMLIGTQMTLTGFYKYISAPYIFSFPIGYLGSLLFSNMAFMSLLLFTSELFNLKGKNLKLLNFYRLLQLTCFVGAISVLIFQNYLSIPITRFTGVFVIVCIVYTAIKEVVGGNKTAYFFLFSWAPIIAGIILTVLVLNGYLEQNTFTNWILSIGSVLESLLLGMAIGNRLNTTTKEKIQEQNLRIKAYQQIEENFDKLKQRDTIIKSFVSPSILTEVALKRDPINYPPQSVVKAILFADIRDYTPLTEKNKPSEAYEILNLFFQTINKAVFDNEGEVDKLIGDAAMATFDSVDSCLNAICAFRESINKINQSRVLEGCKPIYIGIGVSYGQVLSANFGSCHKLDRTIVGDVVNLASRLEGLSKRYHVDVLCCESFYAEMSNITGCRPIDIVKVKGKSTAVQIYEIYNHAEPKVKKYKNSTVKSLEKAMQLQIEFDYIGAKYIIEELIQKCPEHIYKTGVIMDITLQDILSNILDKIKEASKEKIDECKKIAS